MSSLSRLDWLLLLMTFIWGTNYALVKTAFRDIDPQAFNALRLIVASAVMVGVNLLVSRFRPPPDAGHGIDEIASIFHTPATVTRRDWLRLAWLGLVGHCLYQFLFIGGLAQTCGSARALRGRNLDGIPRLPAGGRRHPGRQHDSQDSRDQLRATKLHSNLRPLSPVSLPYPFRRPSHINRAAGRARSGCRSGLRAGSDRRPSR